LLVQLARRAVANFLDTNRIIETPSDLPEVLREKSGVFEAASDSPILKKRSPK
jgi:AMMECR1 domain-containing protein